MEQVEILMWSKIFIRTTSGGSFFPYMGGCDYVNQLRKKNNSFISRA